MEHLKARNYLKNIGNIFDLYDYILIPCGSDPLDTCDLTIIDLNNKVFVYFYLKRQSGWDGDPRSHEVLRDIFRFMESEYR